MGSLTLTRNDIPFTEALTLTNANEAYAVRLPRALASVLIQPITTDAQMAYYYDPTNPAAPSMGADVHELPHTIGASFALQPPADLSRLTTIYLESTSAGQVVVLSGVERRD